MWQILVVAAFSLPAVESAGDLDGLLREAMQLAREGHFERAASLIDPGPADQTIGERVQLRWTLAFVHSRWAMNLRVRGEPKEGIAHAERAIALAREAFALGDGQGSRESEGVATLELALEWQDLREPRKTLDYLLQAEALLKGDSRWEDLVQLNLGWTQLGLAHYREALDAFERLLAISRDKGDLIQQIAARTGIGRAYEGLSQYGKAISSLELAVEGARYLGDPEKEIEALTALGDAYSWISQSRRAIGCYESALAVARVAKDSGWESVLLGRIGDEWKSAGQLDRARSYFEQSLALSRGVNNTAAEAVGLERLGSVVLAKGDLPGARSYLDRALVLARNHDNVFMVGQILYDLGEWHEASGDPVNAIASFEQVAHMAADAGMAHAEGAALAGLMRAWESLESPAAAIYFGKRSVNAYQRVRGDLGGLEREMRRQYAGSLEKTYRGLADLLIGQRRLPEAQLVLDLLKDEEFAAFVKRDAAGAGAEPGRLELSAAEQRLDQEVRPAQEQAARLSLEASTLRSRANLTPVEKARLGELDQQLSAVRVGFQRFLAALAAELSGTPREDYGKEIRDSLALRDTVRGLGQGVVVVYTLISRDKLRLVLITPDFMHDYSSGVAADELSRKVLRFRDVLLDPARSDPRLRDHLPLAQELYRLLVEPLAADLQGLHAHTIMWCLDGVLRYLPLAALHDGRAYLVERYRNVLFTPASKARLGERPQRQWRALGLGVSRAHERLAALPAVPEELDRIVRQGEGDPNGALPGQIRLDADFTLRRMQDDLYDRYQVVHVASHFSFRPGNEDDSFLLLGDGTHLSLGQLGTLPELFTGVDLLTLSACDTAMGDAVGEGKEVEGFAVVAQRQGARGVIATLWSVADRSTQLLMEELYRVHQAEDVSKAEALRRAQLRLLAGKARSDSEGKPLFTHPYYWAPFVLIGNWL